MSSQFASELDASWTGTKWHPSEDPGNQPPTSRSTAPTTLKRRQAGPSGQSKLQSIKPSNSFSSSRSKPPWLTVTVLPILTRGILRRTQGIMMFVAGKEESWVMQKDESHY